MSSSTPRALARQAARPRRQRANPNYPRALGIGALALVAAACGGSVETSNGADRSTNPGGTTVTTWTGSGGTTTTSGTSAGAWGAGGTNSGGEPSWGGGLAGEAPGGWDSGGYGGTGGAATGGENWGGGLSGDSQPPFGGAGGN